MPTERDTTAVPPWLDGLKRLLDPLERYHRYRVEGLEHVPVHGPAVAVVNHSLATYDAMLFGKAIYEQVGRVPHALGDDLLFRTPGLGGLVWDLGIRPASHAHGLRLLRDGKFVFVAPGGMREALRPSRERYQVRWGRRQGFVRLALRAGAPVVLAACRAADDVYTVYDTPLTALAYRHLKVPVPVARGLGLTLLPRPVELVHRVAPLVVPPPLEPDREDEQVADLHADLRRRMDALLAA